MEKVAPSRQFREGLHRLFADLGEVEDGAGVLSELVRQAARLAVQEALKAEQRDFIGRKRYERVPGRGYRSGYRRGHLDTAEGRLEVRVPQVREAEIPYRSRLFDFLAGNSDVLERLAVEMYARGLSTRDIEAAAFQARDLSGIPLLYLFLDGLYEPLRRHGVHREAVLCAWGITTEGEKVLLSLALGSRESHEAWLELLRDLVRRGLPVPLAITTDGAPGLIRAVGEVWPQSLRVRCWVHRMRNLLAKVPESRKAEVKAHLVAIRDAPTPEAGQKPLRAS